MTRRPGGAIGCGKLLLVLVAELVTLEPTDGCGVRPWKGWKRGDGTQPQIPAHTITNCNIDRDKQGDKYRENIVAFFVKCSPHSRAWGGM